MRRRLLTLTAAVTVAGLAANVLRAQPLDAAAFEALAENRTLYFRSIDGPYGAEQFLPGRRSLWRFEGETTCRAGTWHQEGPAICFLYDGETAPNCWRMLPTGGGLMVRMEGGDPEAVLVLDRIDAAPLPCPHTGPGS